MQQSRRSFVKLAGVAALASSPVVAATGGKESAEAESTQFDVVVVGGGLAGVTAARELAWRGFKVALLEARNRLGGRVFTSKLGNHSLELGGKVIGWAETEMWNEVMRYRMDVRTVPGEKAPDKIILRARGVTQTLEPEKVGTLFADAMGTYLSEPALAAVPEIPYGRPYIKQGAEAYDKVSVVDRLNQVKGQIDQTMYDVIDSFMAALVHGPTDNASLVFTAKYYGRAFFNKDVFAAQMGGYTISTGMSSLVDKIADDASRSGAVIRLSSPVTSVQQSADSVSVTLESGERVQASYAVMAVPINLWSEIAFNPPLNAAKQRVSKEKIPGQGSAFQLRVGGVPKPVFCLGTPGSEFNYLTTSEDIGNGEVMMFGYSADSDSVDVNDPAAMQEAVRKWLPQAVVKEAFAYDWVADPYSLGTWAYWRTGWFSIADQVVAPEGRVYFSGADIAVSTWAGSMSGAIGSALQRAQIIVERLRA